MSTLPCHISSNRPYRAEPLTRVVQRIVQDHDRAALSELHNHRTVFHMGEGTGLRLAEFVAVLREAAVADAWANDVERLFDCAYDLTIDKFANLPDEEGAKEGSDCRNYLAAFLRHLDGRKLVDVSSSPIEAEAQACRSLQSLVRFHFWTSCVECGRRINGLVRRYRWQVNGAALTLHMPTYLSAAECREWLIAHVPDVDPSRPGEQRRVQALADSLLQHCYVRPFSTIEQIQQLLVEEENGLQSLGESFVQDLAHAVAAEKSAFVHLQRPAIRSIGVNSLFKLVRRIFEDVQAGTYNEAALASEFGLSKATFSRFAGSQWQRDTNGGAHRVVPDLWRNTAQTLFNIPEFREAAQEAGILPIVCGVLATAARGGVHR